MCQDLGENEDLLRVGFKVIKSILAIFTINK